ncbi:MAG: hypothetical protein H7Y03_05025 [Chitinophagaceae bacterium]|nr:hypothetical protein [Chitinophagaceae bacterium]
MKSNRALIFSLILIVLFASIYRVIPSRPFGFAPQLAIALFAGAVIKDRKWAFSLPIFSLFLSDLLYQLLFDKGQTDIWGFYEGQWQNYLLFAGLVAIGFFIKKINVVNVLAGSLAAPIVYFLTSNFLVWAGWQGTRGYNRPKTWDGLLMCYADGLPFFPWTVVSTVLFSALLFGGYYLVGQFSVKPALTR